MDYYRYCIFKSGIMFKMLLDIPLLNSFDKLNQSDSGCKLNSRLHQGIQEVKSLNAAYIKQKRVNEVITNNI